MGSGQAPGLKTTKKTTKKTRVMATTIDPDDDSRAPAEDSRPEDDQAADNPADIQPGEVTRLLSLWQGGDAGAFEELLPLIYAELRQLASRYLRRERSGHTLQPTALVNEAYMRLVGSDAGQLENRSHFFGLAARTMRQVLVDHARLATAKKRIGPADKISLDVDVAAQIEPGVDLLEIHDALNRLAELNPRHAQVVELRYFGGMSREQVAEVLGVSLATVERDWKVARLWLKAKMTS